MGGWGGETHPNEHKDKHGDKVVSARDRVLVGQAQQVHDGGAHAEDALDFVARRLVGVDGPDLGLSGRPGGFLQVDLRRWTEKSSDATTSPSNLNKKKKKKKLWRYLWDLERSVICCHHF